MTEDLSPVGIVGLGNMGSAIASRLTGASAVVAVEPSPSRAEVAARTAGVEVVAGLAELADAVQVVFLSLPSQQISSQVVEELSGRLRPGSLIVETSTVAPRDIERLQAVASAHEVDVVGVAILAGVPAMQAGRAPVLVGGDPAQLDRIQPWLGCVSGSVHRFESAPAAMAAKVIVNAVGHTVMVTVVEALAMGAASGIEPQTLVGLLADPTSGMSKVLPHRVEERILTGTYDGGMSVRSVRKDNQLALEMAMGLGVPLFTVLASQSVYDIATAGPHSEDDYAAIAALWDDWTGSPLAGAPASTPSGQEDAS